MSKLIPGIFCPNAAVLCATCHNRKPEESRRSLAGVVTIPEELIAHENEALCDRCGQPCNVGRSDVALCQKIARVIGGNACLWQTGGMCVAAGERVEIEGVGRYEILATEDEEEENHFMLGVYELDADNEPTENEIVYEGHDIDRAKEIWSRVRLTGINYTKED